MRRRDVMAAGLAACVAGRAAMAQPSTPEELAARVARALESAREDFPYEIVRIPGASALSEWERLKSAGRGYPILMGSDEDLLVILGYSHPSYAQVAGWPDGRLPTVAEILARADDLRHPESIENLRGDAQARREQELAADPELRARIDALRQQARGLGYDLPVETGEWPASPPASPGLTAAQDRLTGRPLETVAVVLLPTDDPTTAPAYLRWGGRNENPLPEYHVAAFRSWRDRYGAEIVGMSYDGLNLRVATRPATRDEALALAREHDAYCEDLVKDEFDTLSNLAAALMADDWWRFWWY